MRQRQAKRQHLAFQRRIFSLQARDFHFENGAVFRRQLAYCSSELLPGPGQHLRWCVPDGTRDPASGEPVRDDLLVSAALSPLLDREPWSSAPGTLHVVRRPDPLDEMRGF